ncbi:aurora kinase A and ninein-interacting protein [Tupaia chinensis]|uniref:aurora kinase A and ninein-interacting protein n=1 Tax=Tupaia chinensis TaxID=246437 RepID=UPI0003C8E43F|nr:aurora kinase A and ninein-interacting protein [Tupaia chinensis]
MLFSHDKGKKYEVTVVPSPGSWHVSPACSRRSPDTKPQPSGVGQPYSLAGGIVWPHFIHLKQAQNRPLKTHLIKPGTKMLTLLPREREVNVFFGQRRTPPAGIRQTSIASFFTSQPGKTNGGNQRSVSPPVESHTDKESKTNTTQPGHLIQGLGDGYMPPPLATSTPSDVKEAGLSSQSPHHRMGTPFLTVQSFLQPDTLIHAGEGKPPLASSFTQDLESSCLLDQKKREKDSSKKKEWLFGSQKNYQGMERGSKPPGDKRLLDKSKLERKASTKENRQAPALFQTYRDSWNGEKTELVRQSPCSISGFPWDSEKNDKDSWSQLFTEDSQGQRVIAHNTRAPFQDVTNDWKPGLGRFLNSQWAQCQDGLTQLNLQPDSLFTQDSEGNPVIRHQS